VGCTCPPNWAVKSHLRCASCDTDTFAAVGMEYPQISEDSSRPPHPRPGLHFLVCYLNLAPPQWAPLLDIIQEMNTL